MPGFFSSQPVTEIEELGRTWRDAIAFLVSPQIQRDVFWLKIIFIAAGLIFLGAVIWFLLKTSFLDYWIGFTLKNFLTAKYTPGKRARRKWQKIQKTLHKGGEANLKLAVIGAGQLLQNSLMEKGYGRENLLWQLQKLTKEEVSNLDTVVAVCKVYEAVLRDPDYALHGETAADVLKTIEAALKDLEVF